MIILADFTAGLTIEQAINEALDFAERNNVGVRAKINDINMTFFSISNLTREELVEMYLKSYRFQLENKIHE